MGLEDRGVLGRWGFGEQQREYTLGPLPRQILDMTRSRQRYCSSSSLAVKRIDGTTGSEAPFRSREPSPFSRDAVLHCILRGAPPRCTSCAHGTWAWCFGQQTALNLARFAYVPDERFDLSRSLAVPFGIAPRRSRSRPRPARHLVCAAICRCRRGVTSGPGFVRWLDRAHGAVCTHRAPAMLSRGDARGSEGLESLSGSLWGPSHACSRYYENGSGLRDMAARGRPDPPSRLAAPRRPLSTRFAALAKPGSVLELRGAEVPRTTPAWG
jgi:hypothetical protein